MRVEASVTSISWIPSEAIEGMTKLPFELGIGHYDPPPPDTVTDLDALRLADGFRFANELRAWIDVEDGRITGHGQAGGGRIGSTTLRVGPRAMIFPAVAFPDLRPEPEVSETSVRFVQSAGGRCHPALSPGTGRKSTPWRTAMSSWPTGPLTFARCRGTSIRSWRPARPSSTCTPFAAVSSRH